MASGRTGSRGLPTGSRCCRPEAAPLRVRWWHRRRSRPRPRRCGGSRCAVPRAACSRGWPAVRPEAPDPRPLTSARARAQRCCWPPESSSGLRVSIGVRRSISAVCADGAVDLGCGLAHQAQGRGDVFVDRHAGVVDELLVDHRHLAVLHLLRRSRPGPPTGCGPWWACRGPPSAASGWSCPTGSGQAARSSCRSAGSDRWGGYAPCPRPTVTRPAVPASSRSPYSAAGLIGPARAPLHPP